MQYRGAALYVFLEKIHNFIWREKIVSRNPLLASLKICLVRFPHWLRYSFEGDEPIFKLQMGILFRVVMPTPLSLGRWLFYTSFGNLSYNSNAQTYCLNMTFWLLRWSSLYENLYSLKYLCLVIISSCLKKKDWLFFLTPLPANVFHVLA